MESNCLGNIALHEFGHALGLHHEMNRSDITASECPNKQYNELEAFNIGKEDHDSIMNYCHLWGANGENQRLDLSDGDLATIDELYSGSVAYLDFQNLEYIPNGLHIPDFTIEVLDKDEKPQEFRVRTTSTGKDCYEDDGPWSEIQSAETMIDKEMLKGVNQLPDLDSFRLCVESSQIKDSKNYSSFDFISKYTWVKPMFPSVREGI